MVVVSSSDKNIMKPREIYISRRAYSEYAESLKMNPSLIKDHEFMGCLRMARANMIKGIKSL